MKKLNRKGFTLIELLAIIVILAIIMVVTIPTVLGSLGEARQKTFEASAGTVAEYIEKQYSLYQFEPDNTEINSTLKSNCFGTTCSDYNILSILNQLGVKASNYSAATVTLTGGRACVKLTANLDSGDFTSLKDASGNAKVAQSSGC